MGVVESIYKRFTRLVRENGKEVSYSNPLPVDLASLISGEDQVNNWLRVFLVGSGGAQVGFDQTDRQRVSLYAKKTNPGDTALKVTSVGEDLLVALPTGQFTLGDAISNSTSYHFMTQSSGSRVASQVFPATFNESSWDRLRGNTESTLLTSAARTATTNSGDQTNFNARGLLVILRVTAASGTGGLTLAIQGRNPIDSTYYQLNQNPAAVTSNGSFIYVLYPGAAKTPPGEAAATSNANQVVSLPLPRIWRVSVAHGDGSSYTYGVTIHYVL